ncbi:MAG: hypothetical protein IBX60_07265 [Candidatus Aminicenantes bacterium]|nr:hypothetical protein [Candidatus Aminicenantes bacterium]
MIPFFIKLKQYFLEQPLPHASFYISSRYISGIQISETGREIKQHFICPLEDNVIQPSFHNENIRNREILEKKISRELEKFHLLDKKIAVLLPELSQKVHAFSFKELPRSKMEKEKIILFRIRKQQPLLPEDIRVSFDELSLNSTKRVVAGIVRSAVVQDYEDFFNSLGLKVRVVGIPSLCLCNLLDKNKNLMLVNINDDSFSLVAAMQGEIILYRQKPIALTARPQEMLEQKMENIIQEIENTIHFMEDKEKKQFDSLWIRPGFLESNEEIYSRLGARLELPVQTIDASIGLKLSQKEKRILSPLIGQLIWRNKTD